MSNQGNQASLTRAERRLDARHRKLLEERESARQVTLMKIKSDLARLREQSNPNTKSTKTYSFVKELQHDEEIGMPSGDGQERTDSSEDSTTRPEIRQWRKSTDPDSKGKFGRFWKRNRRSQSQPAVPSLPSDNLQRKMDRRLSRRFNQEPDRRGSLLSSDAFDSSKSTLSDGRTLIMDTPRTRYLSRHAPIESRDFTVFPNSSDSGGSDQVSVEHETGTQASRVPRRKSSLLCLRNAANSPEGHNEFPHVDRTSKLYQRSLSQPPLPQFKGEAWIALQEMAQVTSQAPGSADLAPSTELPPFPVDPVGDSFEEVQLSPPPKTEDVIPSPMPSIHIEHAWTLDPTNLHFKAENQGEPDAPEVSTCGTDQLIAANALPVATPTPVSESPEKRSSDILSTKMSKSSVASTLPPTNASTRRRSFFRRRSSSNQSRFLCMRAAETPGDESSNQTERSVSRAYPEKNPANQSYKIEKNECLVSCPERIFLHEILPPPETKDKCPVGFKPHQLFVFEKETSTRVHNLPPADGSLSVAALKGTMLHSAECVSPPCVYWNKGTSVVVVELDGAPTAADSSGNDLISEIDSTIRSCYDLSVTISKSFGGRYSDDGLQIIDENAPVGVAMVGIQQNSIVDSELWLMKKGDKGSSEYTTAQEYPGAHMESPRTSPKQQFSGFTHEAYMEKKALLKKIRLRNRKTRDILLERAQNGCEHCREVDQEIESLRHKINEIDQNTATVGIGAPSGY